MQECDSLQIQSGEGRGQFVKCLDRDSRGSVSTALDVTIKSIVFVKSSPSTIAQGRLKSRSIYVEINYNQIDDSEKRLDCARRDKLQGRLKSRLCAVVINFMMNRLDCAGSDKLQRRTKAKSTPLYISS
jgi:hypothetical protein